MGLVGLCLGGTLLLAYSALNLVTGGQTMEAAARLLAAAVLGAAGWALCTHLDALMDRD